MQAVAPGARHEDVNDAKVLGCGARRRVARGSVRSTVCHCSFAAAFVSDGR